MCKNCFNYLNVKLLAFVSLIIDLISGILLFVWKDDQLKTAITNAIDKIIHSIINLVALGKDLPCCKKEINKTVEKQDEEMKPVEECKKLREKISDEVQTIQKLNKFVEDNANTNDMKIKQEVEDVKGFLKQIKSDEQKMINIIKVN